jgi:flagellar biosynthetic protein FliQ
MPETEIIAVAGQQALWVALKVGAPLLLLLLAVGLVISLLQALTQIQEASLAFVPKLAATGLGLLLLAPMALSALRDFTMQLFDQMVTIGGLR